MRNALLLATPLTLVALVAASCDDTTLGQLVDDPGPPVLMHVLVQDAVFFGGRRMATDLLEKAVGRACSTTEPCPSGEAYQSLPCHFPDPNKDQGTCPIPLNPNETPAPSSTNRLGGSQIRIVLSKVLAADTDSSAYDPVAMRTVYTLKSEIDKSIGLFDGDRELATTKYYDPAGSPNDTSDLFFTPYGPALVIKPKAQLVPLKTYTIKFNPSLLKDNKGQAVAPADRTNSPVASSYTFTVEGVYMIDPLSGGGNVGFDQFHRWPGGQTIPPEEAVVLFANWPFDPLSVKAAVRDANGNAVPVAATAELGVQPTFCRDRISNERINVMPVDAKGNRALWPVGNYLLDLTANGLDLPGVTVKADNLGAQEFKNVPFVVKTALPEAKYDPTKDPYATQNLLLPTDCPLPPSPDGGM